jgi:hypothetical protein
LWRRLPTTPRFTLVMLESVLSRCCAALAAPRSEGRGQGRGPQVRNGAHRLCAPAICGRVGETYPYGTIRFVRLASRPVSSPNCRRLRFRLLVFFDRRWLRPAFLNRTRPVAVILNRFAAAFLVFAFVFAMLIATLCERLLDALKLLQNLGLGRQDHRHPQCPCTAP